MDVLFVDDEVISFCFLVFLLTVRPLCCRTAEVHSRPACLGITCSGYRTVRIAASFLFCYVCPKRISTRCLPELSFMRCLFGYMGVRELIKEAICPLSELECCAVSSVAPFRAAGHGQLSLLQQNSQPPLFPDALSQEVGALFISP